MKGHVITMAEANPNAAPKARIDGLVVQKLPGEVLIYDLQRHKAHCLNGSAAVIWNHCNGNTTVTEMAGLLERELKRPVDEATVLYGLNQLEKARLLAGAKSRQRSKGRMTRRDALRKVGLAAAVGLPLVTSILAPCAVEAATCRPSGQGCGASAQCCSGVCSNMTCV
jgi:hypothetical protein